MGENGAGNPAARAIAPPAHPSESGISTAKPTTSRSQEIPTSSAQPVNADWGRLATAPTLMLTPNELADADAASTSRIATPAPMAVEEQPWFRTGTTVAPPSMRPMGESLAPPPVRKPPNPRVYKIVAGVIAACLVIVALAGMKLIYRRLHAPATAQAPSEESTPRTVLATADLAGTPPPAPESARPADQAQGTSESAVPGAAQTAPATPTEAAPRTTPVRSSTSPARVTPKTTPRRAPVPKKTGKGVR